MCLLELSHGMWRTVPPGAPLRPHTTAYRVSKDPRVECGDQAQTQSFSASEVLVFEARGQPLPNILHRHTERINHYMY